MLTDLIKKHEALQIAGSKEELGLLAPIHIFAHMVYAFFESDPEVEVSDVVHPEEGNRYFIVRSENAFKLALGQKYIGKAYTSGGQTVEVKWLFPGEDVPEKVNSVKLNENESFSFDIDKLLIGNTKFSQFTYSVFFGAPMWHVVFKHDSVCQYFNEDKTSLYGLKTVMMEELCRELLHTHGIHYSTEPAKEVELELKDEATDGKIVLFHIPQPGVKLYYSHGRTFTTNVEKAKHYATSDAAKKDQSMIMEHSPELDIQIEELA